MNFRLLRRAVDYTQWALVLAAIATTPAVVAQQPVPCRAAPVEAVEQVSTGEVGASLQLTWQPSARASSYDVYLGPSDPPAIYAQGLTTTSFSVSGLAAGTKYYWYVVAHAECDTTLTSRTATRSFTVDGGCGAVGTVSLEKPANTATEVSTNPTFDWTFASGAASYALHLGRQDPPELIASGRISDKLEIPHLLPNTTYYWKVVARSGCNASASSSSAVFSFTTSRSCPTPPPTRIVFVPRTEMAAGQTYSITWLDLDALDPGGSYIVERASDAAFSSIIDQQQTTSSGASFVSHGTGTLYHRVRVVAGCDSRKTSGWSEPRTVIVGAGKPNVVFTVQARPVMAAVGARIEDLKATFAIENIGASPISVLVGKQELSSVPFFQVVDPLGGDASFFTLEPRKPKTLDVRFSGPPNGAQGSYQGIVTLATPGESYAVTPLGWVSLRVGSGSASPPVFLVNGVESDYAVFPPREGDDSDRPALSVDILNSGSAPMDLMGQVGPEMWLLPETGWNATPIAAGSFRPLRLYTRRNRAPNGSALPRYTYFSVVNGDGESARLLVQDNGATETGAGRPVPEPGDRSLVIPLVTARALPSGGRVVSRIRMSNVGGETAQAQLAFTPTDADGFDISKVKRATVVLPANDVVTLTDPLGQLFGLASPVSGQMEIRVAPEKLATLVVAASVETIEKGGGSRGYAVPVAMSGEGARVGVAHMLAGVTASASLTTDLVLAETTGREATTVRITLFNTLGTKLGEKTVAVPRFGRADVAGVAQALGSAAISGGRLELEVTAGGGAVVGCALVKSTAIESGAILVSQLAVQRTATSRLGRESVSWISTGGSATAGEATQSEPIVVPYIVNGVAPLATDEAKLRTALTLAAPRDGPASFSMTYRDTESGRTSTAKVDVAAGAASDYANAAEQLFGVGAGARSQGLLLVEATGRGRVWARVVADLQGGAVGESVPVSSLYSEAITGSSAIKPLVVDGLEQSFDASRGTRSTLVLDEVSGQAASVSVRLYEAGNRTQAIAIKEVSLPAKSQVRLESVFSALGLDAADRRKDRTNVQCVVVPTSARGLVAATVVTTDNKTGEITIRALQPAGNAAVTGVQRSTTSSAGPIRIRPVRR